MALAISGTLERKPNGDQCLVNTFEKGSRVKDEEALKKEYRSASRTEIPGYRIHQLIGFIAGFPPVVGCSDSLRSAVSFVASQLNFGPLSLSLASDAVFILRRLKLNVREKKGWL